MSFHSYLVSMPHRQHDITLLNTIVRLNWLGKYLSVLSLPLVWHVAHVVASVVVETFKILEARSRL